MKIAIIFRLAPFYQRGFNDTAQIVVEVDRLDELDLLREQIETQNGKGSFLSYFSVPDCAQAIRTLHR